MPSVGLVQAGTSPHAGHQQACYGQTVHAYDTQEILTVADTLSMRPGVPGSAHQGRGPSPAQLLSQASGSHEELQHQKSLVQAQPVSI